MVGSNTNITWNYGGYKTILVGPIECPMGPWGPMDFMAQWAPWVHRAGRPRPAASGQPFSVCFTEESDWNGHCHTYLICFLRHSLFSFENVIKFVSEFVGVCFESNVLSIYWRWVVFVWSFLGQSLWLSFRIEFCGNILDLLGIVFSFFIICP